MDQLSDVLRALAAFDPDTGCAAHVTSPLSVNLAAFSCHAFSGAGRISPRTLK
jgi:hypothetical protein